MSEILRTEHVCMYFGGLKAVDDVSFQVDEGQIYGIIGPNGAGKTTLFNMCSGVYKPTKGSIYPGKTLPAFAQRVSAERESPEHFRPPSCLSICPSGIMYGLAAIS